MGAITHIGVGPSQPPGRTRGFVKFLRSLGDAHARSSLLTSASDRVTRTYHVHRDLDCQFRVGHRRRER